MGLNDVMHESCLALCLALWLIEYTLSATIEKNKRGERRPLSAGDRAQRKLTALCVRRLKMLGHMKGAWQELSANDLSSRFGETPSQHQQCIWRVPGMRDVLD